MHDRSFFYALLGAVFIFGGILNLRRARSGLLRGQQFITLGKNPIEPEQMTPITRRFTRYYGIFSLILGALFVGIAVYHCFR